jgi:hypothetical protein
MKMSEQKIDIWAVPAEEKEERENLVSTLMNLFVEAVHTIRKVSRPIEDIRMLVRANQLFHNCTLGAVYTIGEIAVQEKINKRRIDVLNTYLLREIRRVGPQEHYKSFLSFNFLPDTCIGVKTFDCNSLHELVQIPEQTVRVRFGNGPGAEKDFQDFVQTLNDYGLRPGMDKGEVKKYFSLD